MLAGLLCQLGSIMTDPFRCKEEYQQSVATAEINESLFLCQSHLLPLPLPQHLRIYVRTCIYCTDTTVLTIRYVAIEMSSYTNLCGSVASGQSCKCIYRSYSQSTIMVHVYIIYVDIFHMTQAIRRRLLSEKMSCLR